MDNFFTDNKDIQFLFDNIDLTEVIRLREGDFSDAKEYDYAFTGMEDAKEGVPAGPDPRRRDLRSDYRAPRARGRRRGRAASTTASSPTRKGSRRTSMYSSVPNLMGFTLPRKYGGLNFPTFVYTMAIEMVSRADATPHEPLRAPGHRRDHQRVRRRGAARPSTSRASPAAKCTGAMALTEPDAGSDLQAVQLQAYQDEATGSGTSTASSGSSPTAAARCSWCSPAARRAARTGAA